MKHANGRFVPLVDGLKSLANAYDLVLCDVWGVLHNGLEAYPAASDALTRFRTGGGRIVLVSNAPRPGTAVAAQLDRLGVPRSAYDAIVTSGDLTRKAIEERLEEVVHHMGPRRDKPLFENLDIRFGPVEIADYVVCSGFDHEDEGEDSVEESRPRLEEMRARDLLMVCANPDLVVERGDRLIPCAGALAAALRGAGRHGLLCGQAAPPRLRGGLCAGGQARRARGVPAGSDPGHRRRRPDRHCRRGRFRRRLDPRRPRHPCAGPACRRGAAPVAACSGLDRAADRTPAGRDGSAHLGMNV